jgi:hypothetical protein
VVRNVLLPMPFDEPRRDVGLSRIASKLPDLESSERRLRGVAGSSGSVRVETAVQWTFALQIRNGT